MVAVAVVAVLLGVHTGLKRRAQRLLSVAIEYGREAERQERDLHFAPHTTGEMHEIVDRMHWLDAVGSAYRDAAAGPWYLIDPDPERIICRCGYHAARRVRAAGARYPRGEIGPIAVQ